MQYTQFKLLYILAISYKRFGFVKVLLTINAGTFSLSLEPKCVSYHFVYRAAVFALSALTVSVVQHLFASFTFMLLSLSGISTHVGLPLS